MRTVGGNLSISNQPGLFDLKGLENLERIGGSLILDNNYNLKDFSAISSVAAVDEDVIIYRHPKISSFKMNALSSLRDLVISENGALEQFSFPLLKTVDGVVKVTENPSLLDLGGISSIASIGMDLIVALNDSLRTFFGEESSLSSIKGGIQVYENDVLDDLDGVENIASVRFISLSENPNLKALNFEKLTVIDEDFSVTDSPSLVSIRFANLTSVGGGVKISSNPSLQVISFSDKLKAIKADLALHENVNLFNISAPSLETVQDLRIVSNEQIVNFGNLGKLKSVKGAVELRDMDALQSLVGLDQLSGTISADLILENLPALNSISSLSSVSEVRGRLSLVKLPSLQSLDGFQALRKVNKDLTIDSLESLNAVTPISQLTDLGGNLTLSNLDKLDSLDGLEGISELAGGYLLIFNLSALRNLTGLKMLKRVNGFVDINANNELATAEGLENLESVGGLFRIKDNPKVYFIFENKLSRLARVGSFEVTGNPNLESCKVQFFESKLDNEQNIAEIFDNNDDTSICSSSD